jgi:tetratricopeptide (TPR) repeat protein
LNTGSGCVGIILQENMTEKPGRNDPCPCGSGKKYKKCCALTATGTSPAKTDDQQSGKRLGGPPDLKALFGLLNAGRYAELETKARSLVELHRDAGLVWKLLGAALWMQGKDALPALEQAVQLLADDAEAHTNLGNVLRGRGRLEEAAVSHRRAIDLEPDYADAHNNLGSVLRDLGRIDDALASYRRALAIKPDLASAHNNLGVTLRSLGRLDEAAASYRRAIVMKPDFAEAQANLGDALQRLGRRDEAVMSYRRAVVINPNYTEAHSNLGAVLMELGRLEEAAASYRRTIAIKPDHADAHNNLGNALRDLGQTEEAVASYRRALELTPGSAEVDNNLGNALFDLGKLDEAVQTYLRAIDIKPEFARAHSNLASAFREIGKLDEAESSYQRSLELTPDDADIRTNLAIVQRLMGRPADAEASCRRALQNNPDSTIAIAFLAELHADKGRFSDAEHLFQRVISIAPDSPQAWAGIAGVRKMTGADRGWISEAERIAGQHLRPREEVQLRYAIGKYFDDVKNFERAFTNYRRANELTKTYRPPHDRENLAQTFDFVAQLYGEDWVNRSRAGANESSRPVFIVGTPRSGTSLAEQILASHPSVFGAGELSFWKVASPQVAAATVGGEAAGDISSRVAQSYLELLAGLSADASRVVDKMPANFAYLGLIHAALPQARIIHMQRNPIDTCLSIYFQNFHVAHSYANDLDDIAHFYDEYLRVMNHWRSILPEGTILDVPYEELVDDQEGWSRKMVDFVGLPWAPACLDFHQTNRSVSTFSKWQVRQKITKSSVERWRNYEEFVAPLLRLAESTPHAAAAC